MALLFGGSGVGSGRNSTTISLQGGQTYIIPAGTWTMNLGPYTDYQILDNQTGLWRNYGDAGGVNKWVSSDGVNHRLANSTGCVVGATVTSGGVGYTSAPTVTANSGGATFTAILGPVVSSITVANGGTSYTYPPLVYVNPPPVPGIPATAYSTISGGVVTSITMVDYGAGYSAGIPNVSVFNDPRDTTGAGCTAVATLAGSGTVAAVVVNNYGSPTGITSGTLPTLTLTGGGYTTIATAVPIMNWSATGVASLTSAGAGYTGGGVIQCYSVASGTPITYKNPTIQQNLIRPRSCQINANISTGGAIQTGGTVYDGGSICQTPTVVVVAGQISGGAAGVALPVLTLGSQTDVAVLSPV